MSHQLDVRGSARYGRFDLASYESVLAFGDRVANLTRLDVAILNAALATRNFELAEGYERTITVNVINTLLLGLLLPVLRATRQKVPSVHPRLTFVVSEVHAWAELPERNAQHILKALSDPSTAKVNARYPVSKLLEVLLVQELAGRVRGSEVIINMVNPGLCHSALGREMGIGFMIFKLVVARSTDVGSRTLVASASAGLESHGAYMSDSHVENTALSPFVRSEEGRQAREKLWSEVSVILEDVRPGVMQSV